MQSMAIRITGDVSIQVASAWPTGAQNLCIGGLGRCMTFLYLELGEKSL